MRNDRRGTLRSGILRTVVASAILVALAAAESARSDEPVDALPPRPAACAGNPSFCGITLRIDSDAGTIPSVAAGAHYGPAWGIPSTENNSTGVGWCVDDTHTGFPVGPIDERPLPATWTAQDMRRAATIITLFGGDRVLPYQPLRIDTSGELAGVDRAGISATRHRQIAVWFALRSLLPDVAGTPRVDLDSARTFSDPGGRRPSAIGDSAVRLARRLVEAADEMTAASRPVVTVSAADGAPATAATAHQLTVHLADDTGQPLPHHPVWPSTLTNATVTPVGAQASPSVAHQNAQAAGWPSLDSGGKLSRASVTDSSGNATFTVTVEEPGPWRVEFDTAAPPSQLHMFGDGINAQNNVTVMAAETRHASGSIAGEVVERHVRVVKTSTDPTFAVDGAVIALVDADGGEIARGTTDTHGVLDFSPIDARHPLPFAIREIVPPVGLARRADEISLGADAVSSDPADPTVVEVENHPVLHELIIEKEVSGSAGFGPSLAGFTFVVSRGDGAEFGTVTTDEHGRTPPVAVPAGDYSIREIERATRWPGDQPLPDPVPVTVPTDSDEPIEVVIENVLPPPSLMTLAADAADGDKYLTEEGGTIADVVEVCDVVEGTTYSIEGELMFVASETGTAETTGIRARSELLAAPDEEGCQTIEIEFDVPSDSEWLERSGRFVVTEEMFVGSELVAVHHDLESIQQSIFVATVHSEAVDAADGDSWIDHHEGTVRETLTLGGLDPSVPEVEIRADSTLMTLSPDGSVLATGASGTSTATVGDLTNGARWDVEIPYSSDHLPDGGGTGVVFTTITDVGTGLVIARHHEPENRLQQVRWGSTSVPPPPPETTTTTTSSSVPARDLPRTGMSSTVPLQRWGAGLALVGSLLFVASGTRRRRSDD